METSRIYIVVDVTFGARLVELASEHHVWIVQSDTNKPFIERIWAEKRSTDEVSSHVPGVTSFPFLEGESSEAACARISDAVDDHHGTHASSRPWSEIEVLGAELTPGLAETFQAMNAECIPMQGGFKCRRRRSPTSGSLVHS